MYSFAIRRPREDLESEYPCAVSVAMEYSKPLALEREWCNLNSPKKEQLLRRVYSDSTSGITEGVLSTLSLSTAAANGNEAEKIECECCGLSEDCTPTYIGRIKAFFFGKWVCGLCSEAVKERMRRAPPLSVEEALESHTALCRQFNGTMRLNPKLTLAGALRDIARKSSQRRSGTSNDHCRLPKIGRTMSCVPRIDGC